MVRFDDAAMFMFRIVLMVRTQVVVETVEGNDAAMLEVCLTFMVFLLQHCCPPPLPAIAAGIFVVTVALACKKKSMHTMPTP